MHFINELGLPKLKLMTLGWWRNWGSTDKPRTINLSRRESERLLKINIEFYEDFFKEVIILPVLYWKCQRSVIQRILERRIKRVFLWWQWYSTCKKEDHTMIILCTFLLDKSVPCDVDAMPVMPTQCFSNIWRRAFVA